MKTKKDLDNLIPLLEELILINDHKVGECYSEWDEDGRCISCDYEDNYFTYEEDGWIIEIYYRCSGEWDVDGELDKAWGEVTRISAYHFDEERDEETDFSEDDCSDLWSTIDKALERIL